MVRTHIDLFSGIGGFALAARWAGIKTVQFVEIDKFCHKVLNKNFPGVPIYDDIKTFTNAKCFRWGENKGISPQNTTDMGEYIKSTPQNIYSPFLLTGGFPCQPFSCAGQRRGKEDDRYLWEEMLRVIKEFKPTWIIGENVAGINSMEFQDSISELEDKTDIQENGTDNYTNVLDGISDSLEAIGYEVQPIVIPACAVNAPHRRDRVWIVAHSNMSGCGSPTSETDRNRSEIIQEQQLLQFEYSGQDSHVRNTKSTGQQGSSHRPWEMQHGGTSAGSNWLEVATRLCRVDDGLPRQVDRVNRLKSLGNAIVPQVAFEIMKAILETEND